jgi:uncharacterized membrane protein
MKPSRRRLVTVVALIGASLFCVALVGVRYSESGSTKFGGLAWNLFLAWIPFVLAVLVYDRWRRGRHASPSLFLLGALWLLFFPNAPYIVTDFVHLEPTNDAPYWYDAVTVSAFAWTGVLLGFASLFLMQTVVRQWRGVVSGWIFAALAIALGSLGIYLGRSLRLNSWDALEHPSVLPRIAHTVARDPFRYGEAIGVTVLFAVALGFAYVLMYNFAVVGQELDTER